MTLKNIATLYQRSVIIFFSANWTLIQRRDVFQCSLNVDANPLCFSVLFERWYNVAMFFSVIWTLIQRRYVFQCHFNVYATSPCFSASFQRLCNVVMLATLYQRSNNTEKHSGFASTFKEHWKTSRRCINVQLALKNIMTLHKRWNDDEKHGDAA
jgi:hypothetical protein